MGLTAGPTLASVGPRWRNGLQDPRFTAKVCKIFKIEINIYYILYMLTVELGNVFQKRVDLGTP